MTLLLTDEYGKVISESVIDSNEEFDRRCLIAQNVLAKHPTVILSFTLYENNGNTKKGNIMFDPTTKKAIVSYTLNPTTKTIKKTWVQKELFNFKDSLEDTLSKTK